MLDQVVLRKKHLVAAVLLACVILISFTIFIDKDNKSQVPSKTLLQFYERYGFYTDPGKYEVMYKNLPESLPELCKLIKAQLVHPIADLPFYRDSIPLERVIEDEKYITVESMLEGLLKYNPQGLIYERKPDQRLLLSCRYHSILLASILKSRSIPVRCRYGFASYLMPGYDIYHVVCEVWNDKERRWMLVDADRQMVDFPREKFQFAGDVWQKYRKGELDPSKYGVVDWWGAHPILSVLNHDLASVLGAEHVYWEQPPVSADYKMDVKGMPEDQAEVMDEIAELLRDPDSNFIKLHSIYEENKYLHFEKDVPLNK